MNLFLASQASETLDLLIPYLNKNPEQMKVLVVTTASNLYPYHPWLDKDIAKLNELHFKPVCIDIAKMNLIEIARIIEGIDLIFVGGGNTSYLLEQAKKSGFFELIKQYSKKDIWYVGSSAGSVIAGPNIEYDKLYDEGEFGKILDSYVGFEFIKFVPIPHAGNLEQLPFIENALFQYGSKYDMKLLTDKQAILIKDNHIQLVEV